MAKAAEAFRNIGEVSAELGVKKHVLRFWEMRFPQLKPMKRGGGRRLYRPADVELLRGILHLLQSAGYTIKGVQKILRERGVEAVKLSDNGRTASAPGRGLPRLVSAAAPTERPITLSSLEVRTLHTIMAELDACQALLAASMGGESGERACERAER